MIIDIFFVILLIMAFVKGYQKGFVIAVFSLVALLIGVAAAMKLSAVMAVYLKDSITVSVKWLPVVSFILVFLLAVFLVRLGAAAIEKVVQLAMLGWINRIGGIILYAAIYLILLSIGIFYMEKLHLLTVETITSSKTYSFIQPWGPRAIQALSTLIPFFENMYKELEAFFGEIARTKN